MSEAEAKAAIAAVIKETGAAGPKDMGKVMGALKAQVRRPDGLRQGERADEGPAEVGCGLGHRPTVCCTACGKAGDDDCGPGLCICGTGRLRHGG